MDEVINENIKSDVLPYDFVKENNPDILCLQETKAHKEQVDLQLDDYPYQYWNSAEKKGYSGTAIFSKRVIGNQVSK